MNILFLFEDMCFEDLCINLPEKYKQTINEEIKSTFTDYVLASECYLIKGNTHIKGSKTERDGTLDEMDYCNFNGTWRLIGE